MSADAELPTPIAVPRAPWNVDRPSEAEKIAIRDGRTARAMDLPNKPPPFVDPVLASYWSYGWRCEDEERARAVSDVRVVSVSVRRRSSPASGASGLRMRE